MKFIKMFILMNFFICMCSTADAQTKNDRLLLDSFMSLCVKNNLDLDLDSVYLENLQIKYNPKIVTNIHNKDKKSTLLGMQLETPRYLLAFKKGYVANNPFIACSLGGNIENYNEFLNMLSNKINFSDIIKFSREDDLFEMFIKVNMDGKSKKKTYLIIQSVAKEGNAGLWGNTIITYFQGNHLSNEVVLFKEEILPVFIKGEFPSKTVK